MTSRQKDVKARRPTDSLTGQHRMEDRQKGWKNSKHTGWSGGRKETLVVRMADRQTGGQNSRQTGWSG